MPKPSSLDLRQFYSAELEKYNILSIRKIYNWIFKINLMFKYNEFAHNIVDNNYN